VGGGGGDRGTNGEERGGVYLPSFSTTHKKEERGSLRAGGRGPGNRYPSLLCGEEKRRGGAAFLLPLPDEAPRFVKQGISSF